MYRGAVTIHTIATLATSPELSNPKIFIVSLQTEIPLLFFCLPGISPMRFFFP